MKLFHAFPRPANNAVSDSTFASNVKESGPLGLQILRNILSDGLLCTPEKFGLYPNLNTENEEKRDFIKKGKPHFEIVQSRACFTLSDTVDLTKEYRLSPGDNSRHCTHTDLFGSFAIGLDPLEARELGIVPTFYYYKSQTMDPLGKIHALGEQIIERLDETRTLFSILSYIEARANPDRKNLFQPAERLIEMGIDVTFEREIKHKLAHLPQPLARLFFELLDTDRVPAWNLVDFIHIMLSLYQKTDSPFENAPLAFFQQREWRLVHHMVEGLDWFGLGKHPQYRNPDAIAFGKNIDNIRNFLRRSRTHKNEDYFSWFFDHSWVMAGTRKKHFRDYIREIVVPAQFYNEAQLLLNSFNFIKPPSLTVLPCRWKIKVNNGIPRIEVTS